MYPPFKVLILCCAIFLIGSTARGAPAALFDVNGNRVDPFADSARARVFLFVRTDCPITNRYAPELARIANEFSRDNVAFWLVYADRSENAASIRGHISQYHLPGTALLDSQHLVVNRAHATVAPEAAVFDGAGRLQYHGRIDDRYISAGKSRPEARVHDLEDALRDVLAGSPVPHPQTRAIGCSLADIE